MPDKTTDEIMNRLFDGATGLLKIGSAAHLANGQAIAGVESGALVAARASRRSVVIRNLHATDTVYVGAGTVSAANGFPLKAGESIPIDSVVAINGIRSGSADITIAYLESYD